MQRPAVSLSFTRGRAALVLMVVGAVLLITAFVGAGGIPRAAHDDFGALIRSLGSISHTATYPDTYRLMAAQSRMLQNAYIGLTGVALVTVGAIGAVSAGESRRREA